MNKKLSELNPGDIVKGHCYDIDPKYLKKNIIEKSDKTYQAITDIDENILIKLNKNCGKNFVVAEKTEHCVIDYGSDPEPYNKIIFREVDDNFQVKPNGNQYEQDDHWTSFGFIAFSGDNKIETQPEGYQVIMRDC